MAGRAALPSDPLEAEADGGRFIDLPRPPIGAPFTLAAFGLRMPFQTKLTIHGSDMDRKDLAPLWPRVCGALADAVVVVVLTAGVLLLIAGAESGIGLSASGAEWALRAALIYLLVDLLYTVSCLAGIDQGTVGQRMFGLRVARRDGGEIDLATGLGRSLASLVSLLTAWLGHLYAFASPRRQTLHDLISGTVVIRVPAAVSRSAVPMPDRSGPSVPSQAREGAVVGMASGAPEAPTAAAGPWATSTAGVVVPTPDAPRSAIAERLEAVAAIDEADFGQSIPLAPEAARIDADEKWRLVISFFPIVGRAERVLRRTSLDLVEEFRARILSGREYESAMEIALEMKRRHRSRDVEPLEARFGQSPVVLAYAQDLVRRSDAEGLKNLETATALIGDRLEDEQLVDRLREQADARAELRVFFPGASDSVEHRMERFLFEPSFKQALSAIRQLGGAIEKEVIAGEQPALRVTLMDEQRVFTTPARMLEWFTFSVAIPYAPRYRAYLATHGIRIDGQSAIHRRRAFHELSDALRQAGLPTGLRERIEAPAAARTPIAEAA